jgi:hypothetical protein
MFPLRGWLAPLLGLGLVLVRPGPLGSVPADPKHQKGAGTDRLGDPLPAGVRARIGSTRLQHGSSVNAVGLSADGKVLVSGGRYSLIRVWDPATGKELHRLQFPPRKARGSLFCLFRRWQDPGFLDR